MIKLRPDQIELFDALTERLFVNRMIEYAQLNFGYEIGDLGEEKTKERVLKQIETAKSYGFVTKQDICDFISLSWHFGDNFDKEYKTKWANEILNDPDIKDGGIRMAKLNDKAKLFLN